MMIFYWVANRHEAATCRYPEGGHLMLVYSETHKTVNTRNIYGMLLCCEKQANNNKALDN